MVIGLPPTGSGLFVFEEEIIGVIMNVSIATVAVAAPVGGIGVKGPPTMAGSEVAAFWLLIVLCGGAVR